MAGTSLVETRTMGTGCWLPKWSVGDRETPYCTKAERCSIRGFRNPQVIGCPAAARCLVLRCLSQPSPCSRFGNQPVGGCPSGSRCPRPGAATGYRRLKALLKAERLNTVCEEALCPNIGECWGRGTSTFMILGDTCTRACRYCAVNTGAPGGVVDAWEPLRVARAVAQMGLEHAVITSVDRDDLADGGSEVFATTIRAIRRASPRTRVEVLIPDFGGNWDALQTVLDAAPEILNHNIESAPRIFRRVRPKGNYWLSLELLERAKRQGVRTKSGLDGRSWRDPPGNPLDDGRPPRRGLRHPDDRTVPQTVGPPRNPSTATTRRTSSPSSRTKG